MPSGAKSSWTLRLPSIEREYGETPTIGSMKDITSVSLIARARDSQDKDSWDEFAGLYGELIRRWLSLQGVQSPDADDVVQEVMSYVFRALSSFEHNGRPGAFRNWLRQVTSNRLREFWRAKKRQAAGGGPDLGEVAEQLADEHSGVSRVWREEYNHYVVGHLLSIVAERFQESSVKAFKRVVLDQRPAKEVADELGMSLGAVRVAQSRVLGALRELGEGLID